jgi:hypothetical protein
MNFNLAAMPALLLTALLFWAGTSSRRRLISPAARWFLLIAALMIALPGSLMVLYYTHLLDNAKWFYDFRTLRYSEISICGLGFVTGFLYSWAEPESFGEKLVWLVGLFVVVCIPFIKPILDPIALDKLQDHCPDRVCRQTTFSTCGPASSASLLLALGQQASEKEIARDSLTSKGGTEIWYLARAFRRRGFKTHFALQPSNQISPPSHSIAGVLLRGGQGHFIAILSNNGDSVDIVDPMKGRFTVSTGALNGLYHFTGFFMTVDRPCESHIPATRTVTRLLKQVAATS